LAVEPVVSQGEVDQAPALGEKIAGYLSDEPIAAQIDAFEVGESGETGVQEAGEVVVGEREVLKGLEVEEAAVDLA